MGVTASRVIVHIPHSSIVIPQIFATEILLEEEELQKELLCMTDWYTDELFACDNCQLIVHHCSRLACDPERFLDPDEERMWRQGMGMYYIKTSGNARLKRHPLASMQGVQAYASALEIYRRHHARLRRAVQRQLARDGTALLIDGHSFSSAVLPYEPVANRRKPRPEICLGTDADFTPKALLAFAKKYFAQNGLRVAVNTPFAGALVPEPFYSQKDKRVESLMIEVNRSLYMDEATGKKNGNFGAVQTLLHGFLENVKDTIKGGGR